MSVPEIDLGELDLRRAVEVWKNPGRYNISDIREALNVVRYWKADASDRLRRVQRGSEDYNDIKREEELLEVYLTGLNDALWTTAHENKMTNGVY